MSEYSTYTVTLGPDSRRGAVHAAGLSRYGHALRWHLVDGPHGMTKTKTTKGLERAGSLLRRAGAERNVVGALFGRVESGSMSWDSLVLHVQQHTACTDKELDLTIAEVRSLQGMGLTVEGKGVKPPPGVKRGETSRERAERQPVPGFDPMPSPKKPKADDSKDGE